MGRRLELNPFAIFLSIAFFAWLWGPIGVPGGAMLMTFSVIFDRAFEEESRICLNERETRDLSVNRDVRATL
jgi:predicted PurR-regulated permease PerM